MTVLISDARLMVRNKMIYKFEMYNLFLSSHKTDANFKFILMDSDVRGCVTGPWEKYTDINLRSDAISGPELLLKPQLTSREKL